jgi:hypothetical protein
MLIFLVSFNLYNYYGFYGIFVKFSKFSLPCYSSVSVSKIVIERCKLENVCLKSGDSKEQGESFEVGTDGHW